MLHYSSIRFIGRLARPLAALALAACANGLCAAPWPEWRGPTRDGQSAEASGWPSAPLWSTNVGEGCTSPVLADGTLLTFGWTGQQPGRPHGQNPEGTDTVTAFEARTGRVLWRQTYSCRYQGRVRNGDLGQYGGPSATPVLDAAGGRLFTLSTDGDLRAWSLRDRGRPLWHVNLYDTFRMPARPHVCGRSPNDYGCTSAPLLLNGDLLVEAGAPDGLVLAFDPATGARRWSSQARDPAGHTGGIVPFRAPTGDALAVLSLTNLVVIRLDAGHRGETLARQEWRTDFACNIPSPAAGDGRLLLTSGYNHKTTAAFDLGADGALRPAWETRDAHAVVTTPVVRRGRVYVLGGTLACLDLATGRLLWRGGAFGHGSLLATADDKLLAFGNGRLALVDIGPGVSAYTELARADKIVPDTCYPHVALSDGLVACKDRAGNLAVLALQRVQP